MPRWSLLRIAAPNSLRLPTPRTQLPRHRRRAFRISDSACVEYTARDRRRAYDCRNGYIGLQAYTKTWNRDGQRVIVTLDDIARRADVSQPTDSRTHVDSPLIRVKGKARIRQIAYKAGYQVNLVARILKKGRLARSDWSCRRSATPTFQSSSSALPILPELPTTLTKAQRGRHGR